MNWFQRYGIPGTYFLGLIIAWVWAFFPCVLNSVDYKEIGVLVGIFFIPAGYIIFMCQQWLYLSIKKLGIYRAAKKKASGYDDEPSNEAYALSLLNSPNIKAGKHKFTHDWIGRRMAVIAINQSVILATVLSPIVSFLTGSCFTLNWQTLCLTPISFFLAYLILILLRLKCKMKCLPWWVTTVFFIFIALFIICHSFTRSCYNMFPRIAIIFMFCFLICLIMFFNIIILRKQVIQVITNFFQRFEQFASNSAKNSVT